MDDAVRLMFAELPGVVVRSVNRLLASDPSIVVNPEMFSVEPDTKYRVSRTPPATCLNRLITLFIPFSV